MSKVLVVYAVPVLFDKFDKKDNQFTMTNAIEHGEEVTVGVEKVAKNLSHNAEIRGASVLGYREVTDEEVALGTVEAAVYSASVRGI